MDENQFWQIIEESRRDMSPARNNGNMDLQVEALREILTNLDLKDVTAETINDLFIVRGFVHRGLPKSQ